MSPIRRRHPAARLWPDFALRSERGKFQLRNFASSSEWVRGLLVPKLTIPARTATRSLWYGRSMSFSEPD